MMFRISKLLVLLAVSSVTYSGCNMPRSEVSPNSPLVPNATFTPATEQTGIPGEQLYWITIAYSSYGKVNYPTTEEDKPRLSFLKSQDEITTIENWILPEDLAPIQHVNYNDKVVLIIFSGIHGTNRHGILIDQIVKNGKEIIVSITFTEPPEGEPAGAILTSPYLVLEIYKMDLPENPSFVLLGNGKEVYRAQPTEFP